MTPAAAAAAAASHLVEAACGAVFAPRGEVPQLHVEEVDQLNHGLDRVGDVSGLEVTLGLLRQLPGDDRRRLSGFYLSQNRISNTATSATKPEMHFPKRNANRFLPSFAALKWRDRAQPSNAVENCLSRSNYGIKYRRNFPR